MVVDAGGRLRQLLVVGRGLAHSSNVEELRWAEDEISATVTFGDM